MGEDKRGKDQAVSGTENVVLAERKLGRWLAECSGGFTPGGNPVYVCSECGFIYGAHKIIPDANFCEKCGAQMYDENGIRHGRAD